MIVRMAEMNASLVTAVLDSGNKISVSPDGFILVTDEQGFSYSFDLPSVTDIAVACDEQDNGNGIVNGIIVRHHH